VHVDVDDAFEGLGHLSSPPVGYVTMDGRVAADARCYQVAQSLLGQRDEDSSFQKLRPDARGSCWLMTGEAGQV
jgi:hypothetical protein